MHERPKLVPTAAETFYIRRRRDGNTIEQEAYANRVSPSQYMRWERGEVKSLPLLDIGELTQQEELVLRRRRKGWSIAELAKRMKVSTNRVTRMETGLRNPSQLQRFWDKQNDD